MNEEENQCRYLLCVNYRPGAERYCCGSCQWQDWKRLQNKKIVGELTVKDLKKVIVQYDEFSDDSPVAIVLGISTTYRLDKCQIEAMEGSDDLYRAVSIASDTNTKALILSIE